MASDGRTAILLADDDPSVTQSLSPFLERAGFRVIAVHDGETALERVRASRPALIILDVLMPGMDGREVLRRLRQHGIWTPTILLTQVGGASERATALDEGADDYLNKPFSPHELLARAKAVLRRSQAGYPSLLSAWKLQSLGLILDRRSRKAYLDDTALDISPKALGVLEYLMTHPDEAVDRERLLRHVWGWDYPAGTRTVDTRIFEIRQALRDDASHPRFIETVQQEGYCFIAPVEVVP